MKRTAEEFFVAGVLGLSSVILPPYWLGIERAYPSPLFPILRTAIENMEPLSTVCLVLVFAIALGLLDPRKWSLLGVAMAAPFPAASFLEMVASPTSHNLWPFEFIIYGVVIGIPAILGTALGSFLGKTFRKRGIGEIGEPSNL